MGEMAPTAAPKQSGSRSGATLALLALIACLAFLASFAIGRYAISIPNAINILLGRNISSESIDATAVLFYIRMPRIIAAMIIGAALSASGSTYQGLFRNPMVSPDILGVSAGAGFGAALGILLSFGIVGIQVMSFCGGISAVLLTLLIASAIDKEKNITLALILTGMVISTLFVSFVSIVKYVADTDNKLPAITYWLMGSLSAVDMSHVRMILIPMAIGFVPLFLLRWKLNVMSFGDEEARAMGLDTTRVRIIFVVCSTLLTASAVSISGMIGWIGLVIPHLSRMLVGPNYRVLLPTSMLVGAIFLLVVDDAARCVFSMEVPLGILTSLIGAPFFVYLLIRGKRGWA